jgi:hypothetical protein
VNVRMGVRNEEYSICDEIREGGEISEMYGLNTAWVTEVRNASGAKEV